MDPGLRTVQASELHELPQAARDILVTWLLNYDPEDGAKLVGVQGRADALRTIERWLVR